MSNNSAVISRGLAKYGMDGTRQSSQIISAMTFVAEEIYRYIHDTDSVPVDTHNLKDSTGIALYMNGALKRYVANPKAVVPRKNVGLGTSGEIWGTKSLLETILSNGAIYSYGFNLVVISAMPYAGIVNALYGGYFTRIIDETDEVVVRALNKYKNIVAKKFYQ